MIKRIEGMFSGQFDFMGFTVEYQAEAFLEPNYGADSDGNRGMTLWWIDYVKYWIYDENMNDVTALVENYDDFQDTMEAELLNGLEVYE